MEPMTVYAGRPVNSEGRQLRETAVYDFLDAHGIAFERVDHAPAFTMEDCRAIERALGIMICKNLFLCNRQETKFYLLMMPGEKVFKTKELSSQIGSARLSFGKPEKMEQFLNTLPGSASVMGLMNDREHCVTLLMDEDVVREPFVGCHPCINTSSIKIKTEDVLRTLLPATGHEPHFVHLVGEEKETDAP